jgi:hypothetical protein
MIQQTIEQLTELRLSGFVHALKEQLEDNKYKDLPFEQRLSLLLDREHIRRHNLKLERRLR